MAGDRVRDEAERLVAAAIAAVSLAARGMGTAGRPASGFATGSAECCVCPVCRLIASMRDPSGDIAERLATGAGDLANGVASMLRALGRPGHGVSYDDAGAEGERSRQGDEFWESMRQRATEQARAWSGTPWSGRGRSTDVGDDESDVDPDPWRAATTAPAMPAPPPKPMAKKAVAKKAVAKKTVAGRMTFPGAAEPAATPSPPSPSPALAKKAAPKKAVPTKATNVAPDQSAPTEAGSDTTTPAKKSVPRKTAVKKAVPPPSGTAAEESE